MFQKLPIIQVLGKFKDGSGRIRKRTRGQLWHCFRATRQWRRQLCDKPGHSRGTMVSIWGNSGSLLIMLKYSYFSSRGTSRGTEFSAEARAQAGPGAAYAQCAPFRMVQNRWLACIGLKFF